MVANLFAVIVDISSMSLQMTEPNNLGRAQKTDRHADEQEMAREKADDKKAKLNMTNPNATSVATKGDHEALLRRIAVMEHQLLAQAHADEQRREADLNHPSFDPTNPTSSSVAKQAQNRATAADNDFEIEYWFNPDDEASQVRMRYDQKRQLCIDICNLPGKKLSIVVDIIQRREKLTDSNSEQLEVDFESLSTTTLRELEAFVVSCQKKPKTVIPTPTTQASTGTSDDLRI